VNNYDTLLKIREEFIEDIGPWQWIATDDGAWDGPRTDWLNSHVHKWLSRVQNFDACVQAGGCQGQYPRLLSTRFQAVYTFEPDPLSFHVLVNNCQVPNIIKFNAALGCNRTFLSMNTPNMGNVGMHTVKEGGIIPQLHIDDLGLPTCGLIALDMEGAEFDALRGGEDTIKRCKPVITCENGNANISEYLGSLGYDKVDQSMADTIYVCQR
jgi:FkbM family methyltransferase